jgi:hypothetical protein
MVTSRLVGEPLEIKVGGLDVKVRPAQLDSILSILQLSANSLVDHGNFDT